MLARLSWRRPDWWLWLLSLAGWVLLLTSPGDARQHLSHISATPNVHPTAVLIAPVAMMLPLIAPVARQAAIDSLWHRRDRVVLLTMLGYLSVWIAITLLLELITSLLVAVAGVPATVAFALMLAAVWHGSSIKRRATSGCWFLEPLAASGWQADRDCLQLGGRVGLRCATACWALMAITTSAAHAPVTAIPIAAWMWIDRFGPATIRHRLAVLRKDLNFVVIGSV